MGTRIKNFDATGVAPNGRLYAGDLNSIQDQYADLSNFSQEVDAATFAVGDSSLRLVKYGTSEARITGALRIDGILRGLGGLYAGAFTTTQRDAIAAGSRPYGLVILNTTTNQYEWNKGTDAAPGWVPLGTDPTLQGVPIGVVMDWPWAAGSIPTWALLPYGQAISRSTYAALNTLASASGYVHGNGDGSTTFGMPDYRGRAGIGLDNMGGTAANRITAGISGISGGSLGAVGGSEGVTLTTAQIPAHTHPITDPGHIHDVLGGGGVSSGSTMIRTTSDGTAGGVSGMIISHTTGITVGNNAGGGGAHPIVQPVIVVNKLMRAL